MPAPKRLPHPTPMLRVTVNHLPQRMPMTPHQSPATTRRWKPPRRNIGPVWWHAVRRTINIDEVAPASKRAGVACRARLAHGTWAARRHRARPTHGTRLAHGYGYRAGLAHGTRPAHGYGARLAHGTSSSQ